MWNISLILFSLLILTWKKWSKVELESIHTSSSKVSMSISLNQLSLKWNCILQTISLRSSAKQVMYLKHNIKEDYNFQTPKKIPSCCTCISKTYIQNIPLITILFLVEYKLLSKMEELKLWHQNVMQNEVFHSCSTKNLEFVRI